jgi:Uma2 family endonuclease
MVARASGPVGGYDCRVSAETDLRLERREPPPGRLSYEQFLEWADEDTWAEWVDGQVILMPVTVAERHAAILMFLSGLFAHVTRFGALGSAYTEPFQMRLRRQRRGRSPDLFFVLPQHRDRMRRHYLDGPADLVVEIVSPESRRRDRVEKLAEYEQAGVGEYWLIDAEGQGAEFRVLGPDGRYSLAFTGSAGAYQSSVLPPLRLRVEWLWQEPGPDYDEVLRTLGAG